MSDIRQRLTDILRKHRVGEFQWCRCGEAPGFLTHSEHVAEVLASELELTELYAPVIVDDDGHTWPHWNEWYDDHRQAQKAVEPGTVVGTAYITEWRPE